MKGLTSALWEVLGLALLASVGFGASDDKTPDRRPDSRLDQPITVSVAYESLEEFCARLRTLTAAAESDVGAGLSPGPSAGEGVVIDTLSESARSTDRGPNSGAGSSDAASDSRLQAKPRPIPVEITCDPTIKDYKVVVRVKEQPLREVMRQIALLFDFAWMQGPQEHPRYHLVAPGARAQLAALLRQRCLAERSARHRQIFKDTVRAVKAEPDELRELAQTDPEAVALALTTQQIGVLRALDDAAVEAVLAGEVVKAPFSVLPADVQAAVKEDFLRPYLVAEYEDESPGKRRRNEDDWLWDSAQLTYQRGEGMLQWRVGVRMDVPAATADTRPVRNYFVTFYAPQGVWGRLALWLARFENRTGGESSDLYQRLRSLETDYGVKIIEQARKEGAREVPSWARPARRAQTPSPSGATVPLSRSYGSSYALLALLLRDLAEQLDINLVADCYWTHREVGRRLSSRDDGSSYAPVYPSQTDEKGTYYVDSNAEYTLERICEQRGQEWAKDGEFFRVRNLLWFVDDPEEVSASVLKEWMRRTDDENRAAPGDYAYLAANLSQRLAENIEVTDYFDDSDRPRWLDKARALSYPTGYHAMKLYSLMPASLRKRAEVAGIDVNAELPESLLGLVEKILGNNPWYQGKALIDKLTPEQLANLRLWTGYRQQVLHIDDTGGREGVHEHYFCVELWSDGAPTWSGMAEDGRVFFANYALFRTQDPDKVGKLAEPYASHERKERERQQKSPSQ